MHSELGASIAHRWTNCGRSVSFTRGMPNPQSEAARDGTAAHHVAELCLTYGQDAIEYIGRVDRLDEQMAANIQVYLDLVREWPSDGDPLLVEHKFNLARLKPPAPMFGTADAVRYYPAERRLRIADYKNGYGEVRAYRNPQLWYYALGALLAVEPHVVDFIDAYIVQPNNGGIKHTEIDALELIEWSVWLMRKAREALDPAAPFNAGPWCKYCPAAGRCPGQTALVAQDMLITPERAAELWERVPALKQAIADLESVVHGMVRAGKLPGWTLEPTRPTQRWRDEADAALILGDVFGLPDIHKPPTLLSPAQIRERLIERERAEAKAAGVKLTVKQAEASARVALTDLIVTESSGERLVRVDGDRPALPAPGAEFTVGT